MRIKAHDWTRRAFVKAAAASGAAALVPAAWPRAARARQGSADVIRLGLIVPESPAGSAAARGAELGAAEAAHLAELLGRRFELVTRVAQSAGDARRAGEALFDDEGVAAVAGGLDEASADALGAAAEDRGRLFLNVGAPSGVLRGERCRRHTFHIEADVGMYADALARWLAGDQGLRRWLFVIADPENADYGRARRALLAQGGEEAGRIAVPRPEAAGAAVDSVKGSGADVVLVAVRGAARAELLRRYREAGLAPHVACLLPSESAPGSQPSDEHIGIWPVLWHHKLFRYGAEQLNDRFQDRFSVPAGSRAWAAWMATKILAEGALRARTVEGAELVGYFEGRRAQFDGHKGASLTFRPWNHQLRQPVYLVRMKPESESAGDAFDHAAELPLGDPPPGMSSRDFLDRLGDGPDDTACRFPGS